VFFPQGKLLTGVLVITAFVFSDLLDGTMARLTGKSSPFGAFLDSTLDRIGDGAIFAGLALYFAGPGDSRLYLVLALICLVMGGVTSYARARAESVGFQAKVGIAERADRLVAILVMTGLGAIFDVPELMYVALWALAVASTVTVVQRIWVVRKQAVAAAGDSAAQG
jgi:CDP-diacylglycerol--glycerol-3-phosphate 3-phosphatidyltransferase/CDP-diacylglycerol--inositol 3-phosphatidyltransferase